MKFLSNYSKRQEKGTSEPQNSAEKDGTIIWTLQRSKECGKRNNVWRCSNLYRNMAKNGQK